MVMSSVLSILFCSALILTFVIFPELFKKNYHRVVFYMAFCDFMSGVGGALGTQTAQNVGPKCWAQWILTTYFMIASILWCTSTTINLYFLVVKAKTADKGQVTRAHVICWGLPLFATFLPFTTEDASVDDDYGSWCYLVNRPYSNDTISKLYNSIRRNFTIVNLIILLLGLAWIIFSLYFWIWLSFIVMIVCLSLVYAKIHSAPSILNGKIEIALTKLRFYPVVTFTQWILATIHNMMSFSGEGDIPPDAFLTYRFFQFSSGVFTTLVFFCVNADVRSAWSQLFINRIGSIRSLRDTVDDRVDENADCGRAAFDTKRFVQECSLPTDSHVPPLDGGARTPTTLNTLHEKLITP